MSFEFFKFGEKAQLSTLKGGVTFDFLHKHECQACPLNHAKDLLSPKMLPSGDDQPVVYILGEAPGGDEDKEDRQFVGAAGRLLRQRIPSRWKNALRWNNTIRCRPPANRDPTAVETECCRPSIAHDIEQARPEAIFGFGNAPLQWATGQQGITKWRGRKMPVKIGDHVCWYFAFEHPASLLYQRKWEPRSLDEYPSDAEFAFALDVENAFAMLDRRLPDPVVHSVEHALRDIELVYDADRIVDLLNKVWDDPEKGIDLETNRLRPYEDGAKLLTAAISTEEHTFAFPYEHPDHEWSQADYDKITNRFSDFLHDSQGTLISFALPFEMEWLAYNFGPTMLRSRRWDDAQSQAYILDERPGTLDLDFRVRQYFGFDLKAISNVDRKQLEFTPVEDVLRYNGLDSRYHRELFFPQRDEIEDQELVDVYEHQLARVPTVVLSQIQGVPLDQDRVNEFVKLYSTRLKEVEAEIEASEWAREFADKHRYPYRPGAWRDVAAMLRMIGFHDFESTEEEELERANHEIADLTIKWRKTNKNLSTYVLPYSVEHEKTAVHPDGLLHPVYALHKTRTWRTSSDSPNVQNVPKRDDEAKEIRRVVPSKHFRDQAIKVCSFDYAGIQARNIAMESLDDDFIDSFWARYDIHSDWLLQILKEAPYWADGKMIARAEANKDDKDANAYKKKFRHRAKNEFVFPSFFGAQPRSISVNLDVEEDAVERLQYKLFHRFPKVHRWQKKIVREYFQNGYVTGLSGFRRRAPISVNELINAPIQADEAIIVLDAARRLSELDEPRYQFTLEIHDDLTFLWPKHEIERNAEVVIEHMIDVPFDWAHVVPIEVEFSVGNDWASTREVGAYASDTWKGGLEDKGRAKLKELLK